MLLLLLLLLGNYYYKLINSRVYNSKLTYFAMK